MSDLGPSHSQPPLLSQQQPQLRQQVSTPLQSVPAIEDRAWTSKSPRYLRAVTPEEQANKGPAHAQPSPTINTKFALEEINSMFNKPLSCNDDDDGDDEAADDMFEGTSIPTPSPAYRSLLTGSTLGSSSSDEPVPLLSKRPSFEIFHDETTTLPKGVISIATTPVTAEKPKPARLGFQIFDENAVVAQPRPAAVAPQQVSSEKLTAPRSMQPRKSFHQDLKNPPMSPIMETSAEYNSNLSFFSFFLFLSFS